MDIKSMTGFGRAETSDEKYHLSVEIKSVNSRFLDLNIRMPKGFNALESRIRTVIRSAISRGKVDLFIGYDSLTSEGTRVTVNMELARAYLEKMEQVSAELGTVDDIGTVSIVSQPEVLKAEEVSIDSELLWERLEPVLSAAVSDFTDARSREGGNLKKDLLQKLDEMDETVSRIEERAPLIVKTYEDRLREKLTELLGTAGIDENRIVEEVTIFSDKVCTDEEIVRLRSHIDSARKKLTGGGPVGRELDFLAQEMNREANTTLSKANDLIVSEDAIGLKTTIEKIREQIQNLE